MQPSSQVCDATGIHFQRLISLGGTLNLAVGWFTALYVSCLFITWFCDLAVAERNPFLVPDGRGGWMKLKHVDL